MAEQNPIPNWHQIAVELLMTDANLALQSVDYLLAEDDQDAVARVVRNAREVYDSILSRRGTVRLSAADAAALDAKLERLQARLRLLGEAI